MRIITGSLKGRRFEIPKGLDVRPTTDRTKESMFNKIEAYKYIEGTRVLDLFAGSGNLGFEAISRGAREVLAVDLDPANLKLIDKISRSWEIDHQIRTVAIDVQQFLESPAHRMSMPLFLAAADDVIITDGRTAEELLAERIAELRSQDSSD